MRSWIARVLPAAVCVGLGVVVGVSEAVTLDPDARVGDRRVVLKWMPDNDDPVYTGNLDLFALGDKSIAVGDVPFFGFTTSGPDIWYWDAANRWFVRLVFENSVWVAADTTGRLDASLEPLCFAVHPMGTWLLAGLADGRIAAWTLLGESKEAVLYPGHNGPVRALAFYPLASPQVAPFVSAGDDHAWKAWIQPGLVDGNKQATPGSLPLVALALTRGATRLVVADAGGTVYVYDLAQPTNPRSTVTGHVGATVTSIAFSENGSRFVTADAGGRVRVWGTLTGNLMGGDEVETDGGLHVAYTTRTSPYIYYVTGNGAYGVLDGFSGREYQVRTQLSSAPVSVRWTALHPAGAAAYFTDAEGMLRWWNLGRCVPSQTRPLCFGGYRLWRGLYPQDQGAPEELVLLRVYDFSDTTWGWSPQDTLRWFVDPDSVIAAGGDSSRAVAGPHNGVPEYYSLQKFYWAFLDGGRHPSPKNTPYQGFYRAKGESEPTPLIPRPDAATSLPLLGDVYIVPNPYVAGDEASQFGPLSPPMVRFFNLPSEATVRIFTSSGDHVVTLDHRENDRNTNGGSLPWDLKNQYGRAVVSGLYLYSVETPSGEVRRGFFTIVR
jgi:hypothetical protein